MRKLLIVGCGGSGGATLSFMMDQLRSDLADHGVDKLPDGWQFVHVDVPTSPSEVKGVGSVPDMGGTYIGVGPQAETYSTLDNALSQRLSTAGALGEIATWAPRRPESVHTPISDGAGQYRALGRAITLSRLNKVHDDIRRAWDRLFENQVNSEFRSMDVPGGGEFDPADDPLVIVVSSMAGGAGASMALDVCRILTLIPGVNPNLMSVFMVTPDIFGTLPDTAVAGTRPNALAMLGEIVASQTGSARKHDVDLMRALGYQNGDGAVTPFKRVFPVGAHVGSERTQFGDGSARGVYRGLGRGLASLAQSGTALQQFIEWDLTNGFSSPGSLEFLGWGNGQWDNIPWGAFGFASISMGRDRYAEYAAQRLARTSADRLLYGHRQIGNPASDEEQVSSLLDNQWSNVSAQLQLPDDQMLQQGVGTWIWAMVLPQDQVTTHARTIVNNVLRPRIDQQPGVNGPQWAASVRRVLTEQRDAMVKAASDVSYGVAYGWSQRFASSLESTTTQALAQLGLPYASGLVKRASRTIQAVLPQAQQLSGYLPPDLAEPSPEAARTLSSLKGALNNPAAITEQVLEGVVAGLTQQIYASLANNIGDASGAMVGELFDPLIAALNESQTVLRTAAERGRAHFALADLRTNEYAAWPADTDEKVADRFSEADNEVMLTSSADFQAQYEADLPASVDQEATGAQAVHRGRSVASSQVITGLWETVTGAQPPGAVVGTVERKSAWSSRAFPRHPESGETLIASSATYDVHVRPAELLNRARAFIARPGRSFDTYVSQSLRDYVSGRVGGVEQHVPESELARRQRDLVLRFGEAVQLARPLASVNLNALVAIHEKADISYMFKFSAVPFKHLEVGDILHSELNSTKHVDHFSVSALASAMSDENTTKRIDIFGTYPNYSPLVYEAVVQPAARQWLAASAIEREAFWTYRRARPLAASLPMHQNERRAMVAGWILGRSVGMVRTPEAPFTQPAQVWDPTVHRWLSFPNPLLTPQSKFTADYDWLPAVLESVLIAIAQCHQPPVMTSLHPYRALRNVFDAGLHEVTPPQNRAYLAATSNIAAWLRTGDLGTGVASVLPNLTPASSIDERAAALRAYLEQYRTFAGREFMAPGDGGEDGLPPAPGGGTFSIIGQRRQASATPIFRDLAPDIYWATNQLTTLLDLAIEQARRPAAEATGTPVPRFDQPSWDAPQPSFGTDGTSFGGML